MHRFKGDTFRLFLFFALLLIWYFPSLNVYFAQDDFWLMKVSNVTWIEWWKLFIPASDVVWYRPLSSQVFFFFMGKLFGWNVLPFHLCVLFTQAFSMTFLYKIAKLMRYNSFFGYLWALLFGFHQIHTVSLSWLATYSFALGGVFMILGLYYLLRGSPNKQLLVTALAISANEVFLLLPVVWVSARIIWPSLKTKLSSKHDIFYVLFGFLLLLIRFKVFPTTVQTELYKLSFSIETMQTLKFYFLRFIGIPLGFDLLSRPMQLFSVALTFTWLSLVFWGVIKGRKRLVQDKKFLGILSVLSLLTIAPFLLLTNHVSPYYLSYFLVGALFVVTIGFEELRKKNNLAYLVGLLAFFLLQVVGSRWTYNSHWLFSRAKLAEKLVKQDRLIHPVGSEEYFSLGANSAAEVFWSSHEKN